MKILGTVKRVPDPNATIKVRPDGTGIVTDNVKYVVNPFDEIAIEEALRIKEKHGGAEVVLVSVGGKVAAGAAPHRARDGRRPRHPRASASRSSSRAAVARVLQEARRDEKPDLVADGQAGDRRRLERRRPDARRAARLAAGHVRLEGRSSPTTRSRAVVTREVDGGLETSRCSCRRSITADLRLNEPRYASLPGIMKARKKELKEIPVAELGVDVDADA